MWSIALFARIRLDPRHRDVQVLLRKVVKKRLFPDFRMGLAELDRPFRLDRDRLFDLVDYVRRDKDTSMQTVETRVLLGDFQQQLSA